MIQPDPIQAGSGPNSGSERSCGARLREARLAAGLSREDVASRLKMPVRVVEALETDHWEILGAPVFVRGQLKSYARLLKLDMDVNDCLDQANLPPVTPPELVSHSHTPHYRRVLERTTRNAVYIVMTAVIVLPVWWAARDHIKPSSSSPAVQSLEVPEGLAPSVVDEPDAATSASTSAIRKPVVASMTPRNVEPVSPLTSAGLSLVFNDESWLEVFDPEGRTLEKGLIPAGERRSYEPGQVGRITVGNVSDVEVRQRGESVDLAPFSKSNVARFRLSSDGSVVPPAE